MTTRQRSALEFALGEMAKIAADLRSAKARAEERGAREAAALGSPFRDITIHAFQVGTLAACTEVNGEMLDNLVAHLASTLKVTPRPL